MTRVPPPHGRTLSTARSRLRPLLVSRRWISGRPTSRAVRRAARTESRLVWILGSPRSGSTWLLRLLNELEPVLTLNEPLIGIHVAPLAPNVLPDPATGAYPADYFTAVVQRLPDMRRSTSSYFLSARYERSWRKPLRDLLLARLTAEVDDKSARGAKDRTAVVIKEPNGSHAADMILSLLPRSRMLFLLRDGRDVVDSMVDALGPGGWEAEWGQDLDQRATRVRLVEHQSRTWLLNTEVTERAYRAHGRADRLLVRYEDLLADTPRALRSIADWLGLEASDAELSAATAKHAFQAIPEHQRGEGRFIRTATPGRWRESMSGTEQAVMEDVMGPKLRELGYH